MRVSIGMKESMVGLPNGKTLNSWNKSHIEELDVEGLDVVKRSQLFALIAGRLVKVHKDENYGKEIQLLENTVKPAETTSTEQPLEVQLPDFQSKERDLEVKIKKILRSPIPSIKLQAKELDIRELKKAIEIENGWKKRKSLLEFFGELMLEINQSIAQNIKVSPSDTKQLQDIENSFNLEMLPDKYKDLIEKPEVLEEKEIEFVIPPLNRAY